jgi:hypothetical protein
MKTRYCYIGDHTINVTDIDPDAIGFDDGEGFVCYNHAPQTDEDDELDEATDDGDFDSELDEETDDGEDTDVHSVGS